MRYFRSPRLTAALLLASLAVSACSGRPPARPELAAPVESTTMGAGDLFTLTIVGEDKLPQTFRVAPDGTVDLPYVHRVKVGGLEPQQVAELVRQKLMDGKVLSDPSVSVDVREYNSKRISVLGQVQHPGSFPLTPGTTVVRAISEAGGFTSIANRDRVQLTRSTGGQAHTVVLSVDAITDGTQQDTALQSGDTIFVTERIF